MGNFSWHTQDTNKVIWNYDAVKYDRRKKTCTVYMKDHKGNLWQEDNYEGYGVFGGKDYYELMAEMNGLVDRDEAIHLESLDEGGKGIPYLLSELQLERIEDWKKRNKDKTVLYPNLLTNPKRIWKNRNNKRHEGQGM